MNELEISKNLSLESIVKFATNLGYKIGFINGRTVLHDRNTVIFNLLLV